jgi:hypothetical protein
MSAQTKGREHANNQNPIDYTEEEFESARGIVGWGFVFLTVAISLWIGWYAFIFFGI